MQLLCDQAQQFCVGFGILSILEIGLDDYQSAYLGGSEVASHDWNCSPVRFRLHAFHRLSKWLLNHEIDIEACVILTCADILRVLRVLQLPNRDGPSSQTRSLVQFLASRKFAAADVIATISDNIEDNDFMRRMLVVEEKTCMT